MLDLFQAGGPLFMVPLLLASIGVVALAIERTVHFRRAAVDREALHSAVREALAAEGVTGARRAAEEIPGPLARVWSEGLAHTHLPVPLLRERLEGVACTELQRLERGVPQVEVVAQVAPLVGILGTVWGMIIAFGGMALGLAAGVGIDGERLTEGISRALVTTGAGLAVAIPATIIHHALRARIDRFTEDLEQTIRDLILTLASAETTRRKAARQRTGADATTPVPSSPPRTAAR
ncbi:MAG: MotA/TolQ/ExbB proton channel family protein [Planctomycetota bacterium]|jgi:biopolymer transport protein ExbB